MGLEERKGGKEFVIVSTDNFWRCSTEISPWDLEWYEFCHQGGGAKQEG